MIFGIGDGNTQVTGSMNFYHRNSIFNKDRGFSAKPPFLSSNATPYNLQLQYDQVVAAGGTPPPGFVPYLQSRQFTGNPADPSSVFFGTAPTGSNGLSPASSYIYSGARARAPFQHPAWIRLQPILKLVSNHRKLWRLCKLQPQDLR